jgi:hypothetical protein
MDLARAPRRARSNARKKGSGYKNVLTQKTMEMDVCKVFGGEG